MDSAEELQSYISKLQLAVEQGRQKLLHSDGAEGKTEVRRTETVLKFSKRTVELRSTWRLARSSHQVSELEQQMEEGDGMVMMYPDFSEDTLTEKPNLNVVQVGWAFLDSGGKKNVLLL